MMDDYRSHKTQQTSELSDSNLKTMIKWNEAINEQNNKKLNKLLSKNPNRSLNQTLSTFDSKKRMIRSRTMKEFRKS